MAIADSCGRTDLRFGADAEAMDVSLIYRALADGQIDVIAGDATSALIDALDLAALADTRHYFPPYDAVPVVRTASLLRQSGDRPRAGPTGAAASRTATCGR